MRNEIAVISTYFTSARPYIDDLIISLCNQTNKEFDWIIFNDGADSSELAALINNQLPFHILSASDLSPIENRLFSINWCKQRGYKYLIFQDSDDWMDEYRVETSVNVLKGTDIVFSDFNLVNDSGELYETKIWANRFKDQKIIDHIFLSDKNCLGLGNTAINLKILKNDLIIRPDTLAPDWLLFYQLIQRHEACYISPAVYYRQHTFNIVGRKTLTELRISNCIQTKQKHYEILLPSFPSLKKNKEALDDFCRVVLFNKKKLEEYIYKHKNNSNSFLWWEETNYDYE